MFLLSFSRFRFGLRLCGAIFAIGILSGCTTQSFVMNSSDGSVKTEDVMQPFFISGIGQKREIDAAKVCGGADKVARVERQTTFLNGLFSGVTFGIYTPQQARVYCLR